VTAEFVIVEELVICGEDGTRIGEDWTWFIPRGRAGITGAALIDSGTGRSATGSACGVRKELVLSVFGIERIGLEGKIAEALLDVPFSGGEGGFLCEVEAVTVVLDEGGGGGILVVFGGGVDDF